PFCCKLSPPALPPCPYTTLFRSGQEHFYLEGQVAFALPGEDGDMVVHSSTQHPTEVQHICARLLGCDFNRVTTVVRRLKSQPKRDRKSTRLNSSHRTISYAVFCL